MKLIRAEKIPIACGVVLEVALATAQWSGGGRDLLEKNQGSAS